MAETEGTTRIVFTGGAEVTVAGPASHVQLHLADAPDEPFRRFESTEMHNPAVWIAWDQVAYIIEVPEYRSAGF